MSDPPLQPHGAPVPHRFGWRQLLGLAVCTALMAGGYGVYSGAIGVPERLNPWAPLNVAAPPNFLTPYKLARTRDNPALCLSALAQTGMRYQQLPDRITGPGCGFENAVRLEVAGVRLGSALSLSCPMALSFAMWERHVLQPAALARFNQPVVAITHLGSYACRNINRGEGAAPGRPAIGSSALSRHATADALDIAGFTLADGQRITVSEDFRKDDTTAQPASKALLLDEFHAGACKYFQGVLGPDYNAVHRDHFHLETGGYSMCR